MIVWIIGLSGSGKTTLANAIIKEVQKVNAAVISLDGDSVRTLFGNDLGYTLNDRQTQSLRICRMCEFFDKQGLHVICPFISLFPDDRQWIRNNVKSYLEVYLDVPLDVLAERDSKQLYSKFSLGEIDNVAGLDIAFPPPQCPDLILKNNFNKEELMRNASIIAEKIIGDRYGI